MTCASKQTRLIDSYYRIAPGQFHYLKFIIEGYDNLAVISSVDDHVGVIRLKCSREMFGDLLVLLQELAPKIKRPFA